MKTTIMHFRDSEPKAVLSYGDHEIVMSQTFIHSLLGVLAMGRKPTAESYPNDTDSFSQALEAISHQMLVDSEPATPEEYRTNLKRYHETGRGYWSTWMGNFGRYE